jgi:hypothetical protein
VLPMSGRRGGPGGSLAERRACLREYITRRTAEMRRYVNIDITKRRRRFVAEQRTKMSENALVIWK